MKSLFAGIIGFILGIVSFGLLGIFAQKRLEENCPDEDDSCDEDERLTTDNQFLMIED